MMSRRKAKSVAPTGARCRPAQRVGSAPAGVGTRIDIVSDAICPWCYIGKRQLERALAQLAEEGLTFSVHWNPFQLNPDMPKEGRDRTAYRIWKFGSPEKAAALDARITEAAAGVGLAFRTDLMTRTPNTIDAHRLIWFAGQKGVQDATMEAVFKAYFIEGRDIGDHAVLADCAAEAGLDRGGGRRIPRRRPRRPGDARGRPGRAGGRGQRRAVVLPGRLWPVLRRHAGRDDCQRAAPRPVDAARQTGRVARPAERRYGPGADRRLSGEHIAQAAADFLRRRRRRQPSFTLGSGSARQISVMPYRTFTLPLLCL